MLEPFNQADKYAVAADIAKFYDSVDAIPFDQQLKRVFFTPELGGEPQVYLTRPSTLEKPQLAVRRSPLSR